MNKKKKKIVWNCVVVVQFILYTYKLNLIVLYICVYYVYVYFSQFTDIFLVAHLVLLAL